jgi:putative ABC transport system permease protein
MATAFGAIKFIGPMLTQIAPGMSLTIEVLTLAVCLIVATCSLAVATPAIFVVRLPTLSSLQRS